MNKKSKQNQVTPKWCTFSPKNKVDYKIYIYSYFLSIYDVFGAVLRSSDALFYVIFTAVYEVDSIILPILQMI